MRVFLSNRTRWILGGVIALGVLAIFFGPLRPRLILALALSPLYEQRGEAGEANGREMCNRLIACGPSAIAPTIDAIRRHSAWSRRYACLPQVLQGLGEPAHRELIEAIDAENGATARAYLVSALQQGFSDFSRLDRWLVDASNGVASPYEVAHFAPDVRHRYPASPALWVDGRLNPEFMTWWRTNKRAKP